MKFLYLEDGDALPMVGLGTWKSQPGEVYQAVREAVRLGYRHIDCAPVYGNEPEIGQALADAMSAGEVNRQELWITSKLWNDSHKKQDVKPALRKTLTDLRLSYLDLYLIHWPVAFRKGVTFPHSRDEFYTLDQVPLSETWQALESCVDSGLTRYIGVSNFSVRKLQGILDGCRIKPSVDQVEMHPLLSQRQLKKFCDRNRIHLTAYSPLGSRDREPAFRPRNEPDLLALDVIKELAAGRGITPAQILLAWAVTRGVSVIPKSVDSDRLRQNLAAGDMELSEAEMQRIDGLDRHYRFISGSFFAGRNSPYTIGGIWDE